MASLRERLMGRKQPTENGNGNGATPPDGLPAATPTGPIAAATGPVTPITAVRPTAPGHSRQSFASRGGGTASTFTHKLETAALRPVEQLKVDLHRRLIERLDLEALEAIKDESVLIQQIRNAVVEFLRSEPTPLSQIEREEVIEQIVYEVTGLGPIEPLFRDHTITDILVNGRRTCTSSAKANLHVFQPASATTPTFSRSSTESSAEWGGASTNR